MDEEVKDDQVFAVKLKPNIYCGDMEVLPDGYDRMGSRYECLRKGVGVGVFVIPEEKRQQMLAKAAREPVRQLSLIELREIAHRLKIAVLGKTRKQLAEEIKGKWEQLIAVIE